MKHRAAIYLFLGVLGISFAALLVRYTSVSPSTSAFYRTFYGSLSLILIILASKYIQKETIPAELFQYSLLKYFILPGLFVGIDFFIWHKAIHMIGSGLATVLANSQVLFSALLGYFFLKEKLSWHWLIILPMGFLGISLIALKDLNFELDSHFLLGSIMALSAGFLYAIFLMLTKRARTRFAHIKPVYTWTATSIFCCITIAILGFSTNDIRLLIPIQDHMILIALGFFVHAISWILITSAIPSFSLSTIGVSLLGQPLLATLLGILLLNEELTYLQVIGLFISFSIILYSQLINRNKE